MDSSKFNDCGDDTSVGDCIERGPQEVAARSSMLPLASNLIRNANRNPSPMSRQFLIRSSIGWLALCVAAVGCRPQQPFYFFEHKDMSHYLDVATDDRVPRRPESHPGRCAEVAAAADPRQPRSQQNLGALPGRDDEDRPGQQQGDPQSGRRDPNVGRRSGGRSGRCGRGPNRTVEQSGKRCHDPQSGDHRERREVRRRGRPGRLRCPVHRQHGL